MKQNTKLYRLSNGIPVVLCDADYHTCKILISLGLGAKEEYAKEYGITHFIEHVLGQSITGEQNFGSLKQKIESEGADIGLYTTYEKIGCFINALPQHITDVVKIVAPQITSPVFNTKNIDKEKQVVLDEYRRYIMNNKWLLYKYENLFKDTGYGHCILGTPETISSFTDKMLSDYYFSHLSCDKCNIVVIGKVKDTENLLLELDSTFGKISCLSHVNRVETVKSIVLHELKSDFSGIKIALAFAAKTPKERKDQIAIGVFRKILQGRLMNVLRYENSLVYNVSCLSMGSGDTKIYTIETESTPTQIETIVKTISAVCKDILDTKPITESELQSANNVINFYNSRLIDSIDKSCDLYAQYLSHFGGVYNFESEKNMLNDIRVIDVINAGRAVLNAPLSVVTMGPEYDCDIVELWKKSVFSTGGLS